LSNNFRNVDRLTQYLLPPSINEWLPEKHLARFVVEVVDQLNLTSFKNAYSGRGSKAYTPAVLLSLLFYGYATGVFSSRKLERSTYDSVAFRYVCANEHPDHDTIATFRKRFLVEIEKIFVQILQIAQQMNVFKLGKISLDGTKVHANASKHHALSWQYACDLEKKLKEEVAHLLRLAEEADTDDIPDGMDIPEELNRREIRLKAIADAKSEIERRAAEKYAEAKRKYEQKLAAREAKEKETGKKSGGKKPAEPKQGPDAKDQVNLTDSESRIMPLSGGGFEQSYNAQACVDVDSMLVVANHITQIANDKKEIEPALKSINALPKNLGTVEPVFGIIKAAMGFRQFLLRGVKKVRGEWNLVCMAWNIKRLYALGQ
jgi:transposase